jgi:hypothetical protein
MASVTSFTREVIVTVAAKLKHSEIVYEDANEDEFARITHLVVENDKVERSLKLLFALARGVCVVTSEWVYRSLEAGMWLDASPSEVLSHDIIVARARTITANNKAKQSSKNAQSSSSSTQSITFENDYAPKDWGRAVAASMLARKNGDGDGLFSGLAVHVTHPQNTVPLVDPKVLERLITAAGGVTGVSFDRCHVCVSSDAHTVPSSHRQRENYSLGSSSKGVTVLDDEDDEYNDDGAVVVRPDWLFDSLCKYKRQPYDEYELCRPESSADVSSSSSSSSAAALSQSQQSQSQSQLSQKVTSQSMLHRNPLASYSQSFLSQSQSHGDSSVAAGGGGGRNSSGVMMSEEVSQGFASSPDF